MLVSFGKIHASQHPCLSLTPKGVKEIRSSLNKFPLFDKSVNELKIIADEALKKEILVPIPKDGGGGYTHEKHKNNYYEMNAAGTIYQISGEVKYAQFVRDMLMKYTEMYPTLGLHPAVKSDTPGKIFWQTLNDNVWLVNVAKAYDCVYDFISKDDRLYIEKNLFYPMADFISDGNPNNYSVFNKMHNHGTWATAAVGMIGYVMGDMSLVTKALYGSNKDGKTGFIRQLDELFSPDGYYTEGPYYQRYAIEPFMTFAQAIQNRQPELKIFSYREGILLKAVSTLLHLAYNSELFYLNDALIKTYKTPEIVNAINIAYKNNPENRQLLDIARKQESFVVSDAGIATVKALKKEKFILFDFNSLMLRDGKQGDEGGVAILRTGVQDKQTCLIFKATSHGLSHGHYDKLSIVLYDNGNVILPDYGAVRFLNIEPKNAGHYTKENFTWGMQTIAHNTVTIDEKSHFNADMKVSSKYHSDIQNFSYSDPDLQVVSGSESNAYIGVQMQRTTALTIHKDFECPFLIDIFKIQSDSVHSLDLPFYYKGQMVSADFEYKKNTTGLMPLGSKNGYQHLWLEATGKADNSTACFTWVNGDRFYSITTLADSNTQLMMTRSGAGDPNFNLRYEPGFMIRQSNVKDHTFVSIIEPHGLYDLSREITSNYQSAIANIELIKDDEDYSAVKIENIHGKAYLFIKANKNFNDKKVHNLVLQGKEYSFPGKAYFTECQK